MKKPPIDPAVLRQLETASTRNSAVYHALLKARCGELSLVDALAWGLIQLEEDHREHRRPSRSATVANRKNPLDRIADLETELKTLHDIYGRQVEQERKRVEELISDHEAEVVYLKSQISSLQVARQLDSRYALKQLRAVAKCRGIVEICCRVQRAIDALESREETRRSESENESVPSDVVRRPRRRREEPTTTKNIRSPKKGAAASVPVAKPVWPAI